MYGINRAIVEAYRKCAPVRTPRPNTPTRIGSKTGSEHAKHEKRWVKREPHKYVKCRAAHRGRSTNKGGRRGMWSRVKCKLGYKPTPNNAR